MRLGMNSFCVMEHLKSERIILAHGGGGLWTNHLIQNLFYKQFANPWLAQNADATLLPIRDCDYNDIAVENPSTDFHNQLAITTDSFVVEPIFFPGGNIGKLAAVGSINDLAVMGAKPHYLTVSFILEEGLLISELEEIVKSLATEVKNVGANIVAGDTKVVPKGKADRIFINTTGIGIVKKPLSSARISEGDLILVSRDIGRHGLAVLSQREGWSFNQSLESDCHELWTPMQALLSAGIQVKCARDLTRGGLATNLIELAETSGHHFTIKDSLIPISEEVKGICELLGFEASYVANEGAMVLFIDKAESLRALAMLKDFHFCKQASVIGAVGAKCERPKVLLELSSGLKRQWLRLSGEQLPRIC
jgi:hydrogenase expression/formation protein HypE